MASEFESLDTQYFELYDKGREIAKEHFYKGVTDIANVIAQVYKLKNKIKDACKDTEGVVLIPGYLQDLQARLYDGREETKRLADDLEKLSKSARVLADDFNDYTSRKLAGYSKEEWKDLEKRGGFKDITTQAKDKIKKQCNRLLKALG